MYSFFGLDDIYNWLLGLIAQLFCMLVKWACWLLTWLSGLLVAAFQTYVPTLPDGVASALHDLCGSAGWLDAIIDVDQAGTLFTAWVAFVIAFMVFRWVRKFIPLMPG